MVALSILLSLTTACAERHPGIEVNVWVEVSAQPAGAARVELDVARLHVTSVRGVPCGEALARALNALQPVSQAWAHGGAAGGGSPLRADVTVPVDLSRSGRQGLATLRPPPGLWCGLELGVGPDAETATSLLVDARRAGAARRYLSASTRLVRVDAVPFSLEAAAPHDLTLQLDAGPPLASLEPAVTDARRDLLGTLLASLRWNAP